jgi:DNA replication protein DnaC
MNTQETLFQLKELKLYGMALAYEAMLNLSVQNRPTLDMAVAQMTEAEILNRKDRKMKSLLRTSHLRYSSVLEDVICSEERNFTKDNLAALADCSFIRRHENLLIQGKCGCGKSFLACALGRQACTLGFRTLYFNMNTFVDKIALSKLDGTFLKLLKSLETADLLILDDFGLKQMDANTRLALLQILEDRYERRSIIIVSQLPISKWYEYLGDETIADAIMDRLVANNAGKIELKGESLRQRKRK